MVDGPNTLVVQDEIVMEWAQAQAESNLGTLSSSHTRSSGHQSEKQSSSYARSSGHQSSSHAWSSGHQSSSHAWSSGHQSENQSSSHAWSSGHQSSSHEWSLGHQSENQSSSHAQSLDEASEDEQSKASYDSSVEVDTSRDNHASKSIGELKREAKLKEIEVYERLTQHLTAVQELFRAERVPSLRYQRSNSCDFDTIIRK